MGLDEQILQAGNLAMSSHLADHHAHAYRLRIEQELGTELPDTDFKAIRDEEDMDIETDNAVARAVAENIAPPPPAQGPEPSEEEQKQQLHEQSLKHKDEDHEQGLAHKQAAHEQQIENTDEKNEQHIKKKAADNVLDTANKAASLKDE